MTSLIACLGTGKGTLQHVSRLIKEQEWDKIFLVTNEFGKENFKAEKPAEFIIINPEKPISDIRDDIKTALQGQIKDFEVAVNFVSGSGKEHMALLSALLKLGLGVRLIALTKEGIKEI